MDMREWYLLQGVLIRVHQLGLQRRARKSVHPYQHGRQGRLARYRVRRAALAGTQVRVAWLRQRYHREGWHGLGAVSRSYDINAL